MNDLRELNVPLVAGEARSYAKPHVPGGVPGMKVSVHQQGEFIENDEFLLPDGLLPAMNLLQSARKARIQVRENSQRKKSGSSEWLAVFISSLTYNTIPSYNPGLPARLLERARAGLSIQAKKTPTRTSQPPTTFCCMLMIHDSC